MLRNALYKFAYCVFISLVSFVMSSIENSSLSEKSKLLQDILKSYEQNYRNKQIARRIEKSKEKTYYLYYKCTFSPRCIHGESDSWYEITSHIVTNHIYNVFYPKICLSTNCGTRTYQYQEAIIHFTKKHICSMYVCSYCGKRSSTLTDHEKHFTRTRNFPCCKRHFCICRFTR